MSGRFADEGDMPRGRLLPDDDPFALTDVLVDELMDVVEDASVPAAYEPVVQVLTAVRKPATEAELAGELEAVALFRSQITRRGTLATADPAHRRRRRVPVIIAAGALSVVTATGAAAATGSLPEPVQRVAAEVLSKVGISVPDGSNSARELPTPRRSASAQISIPADALIRNESAVRQSIASNVALGEPAMGDTRPGATTAPSDILDLGGGSGSALVPLADPPVAAGSGSALVPLADPPVAAGSPTVDPVMSPSEPVPAPSNPSPPSTPVAPSSHEVTPPVEDEDGLAPDSQGGLSDDDDQGGSSQGNQGGPPQDSQGGSPQGGPPSDVQQGPVHPGPPSDTPGSPPHVDSGPPTGKPGRPPDVQAGPPDDDADSRDA